jgi:NitT/TauT family transport system substrate-binding protein
MTNVTKPGSGISTSAAKVSRRTLLTLAGAFGVVGASSAFPDLLRAQQRPALKIGMANSFMSVTYPYITNAQALGFFEEQGVDVEVVMGQGSPQILSLLVAGTVDLVFCNPEPMIQLNVDRSMNLVSLFPVIESQYILSVPEGSAIQTVEDLKGKRIGMFSPQSGIDYLKARLVDAGMTTDDIQIIPTGFGGQVISAVKNSQVDAIMYWSDAMQLFKFSGLNLRLLPKAEWEHGMYQYIGVTRRELVDEKAEALRRALRAMAQGQMMSVVSPEFTVKAYWKQYPNQAPKPGEEDKSMQQNLTRVHAQNEIIGLPPNPTKKDLMEFQWGDQSADAWSRIQDKLMKAESLSKKVDPTTQFDKRFLEFANGFDREKLYQMAEKMN